MQSSYNSYEPLGLSGMGPFLILVVKLRATKRASSEIYEYSNILTSILDIIVMNEMQFN